MRYISDLHTTSLHDALPIYELEETDYFKDLAERLYIDWGISRRWDQKGTNEKPIIHIGHLPKYIFGGYENIVLKFEDLDRKSTRLNSSHVAISYAVFCLKKT